MAFDVAAFFVKWCFFVIVDSFISYFCPKWVPCNRAWVFRDGFWTNVMRRKWVWSVTFEESKPVASNDRLQSRDQPVAILTDFNLLLSTASSLALCATMIGFWTSPDRGNLITEWSPRQSPAPAIMNRFAREIIARYLDMFLLFCSKPQWFYSNSKENITIHKLLLDKREDLQNRINQLRHDIFTQNYRKISKFDHKPPV